MSSIGVLFLTRNEELKIARAINSVRELADEIIVIDDESSDRTVEIARELGAVVYRKALNRNFAEQYMFGFSKIKTDWVFVMDSDEEVPKNTVDWIKNNISSLSLSGYSLWRQNFIFGHKIFYAGGRSQLLRLFKTGRVKMRGKVHSYFIVEGTTGVLDLDVYHYPMESIGAMINKINFYTDLQLEQGDLATLSLGQLKRALVTKPIKLFWKNYIKKRGYKDGIYGLIWCIMNVIGPEILYLKAIENKIKEK